MRQDKTGLAIISRIGGTGTRLIFSGPVAWKNSGKFEMGRDYSVSLGKSLEWSWNHQFGNSRLIFGTETRLGRGYSWMLGRGNFLDFSGKNPVPGKWHSGTQTSKPTHQKYVPYFGHHSNSWLEMFGIWYWYSDAIWNLHHWPTIYSRLSRSFTARGGHF